MKHWQKGPRTLPIWKSRVVWYVPVILFVYHRLCLHVILIVTKLKEQQEVARAAEKIEQNQNAARTTNDARTRNKDKRRSLTCAAIVAKKCETKAKAAQQVVLGQGTT